MVIIPEMDHNPYDTVPRSRDFITTTARVPAGKHTYLYGWQHKRTRDGSAMGTWTPPKATTITWLQNDAGRAVWPELPDAVNRVGAEGVRVVGVWSAQLPTVGFTLGFFGS